MRNVSFIFHAAQWTTSHTNLLLDFRAVFKKSFAAEATGSDEGKVKTSSRCEAALRFYCSSRKTVVLTPLSPDGNRNTTGLPISTCTKVLSTELHNHSSVHCCWTTVSIISFLPPSDFAVFRENDASSLFTFHLCHLVFYHRKKKLTVLPLKVTFWEHFVPWGHDL